MKMICDVPDEVIKCIKDGMWCGSHIVEKMITNGIPLSSSEELCEDAISKQAVNILVDELARAISDERCCMPRGRSTGAIMQDILDLPPVTPQQKTGHWIEHVERDDWDDSEEVWYECDQCHTDWGGAVNFCPNCGAKMQEDEE